MPHNDVGWMFGVYLLFGMIGRNIYVEYTKYTKDHAGAYSRRASLPFLFSCKRCRAILYEDSKPVFRDGTYRRETYLETVVARIGEKCPCCGHRLQTPPATIDVCPDRMKVVRRRKSDRPFLRVGSRPYGSYRKLLNRRRAQSAGNP